MMRRTRWKVSAPLLIVLAGALAACSDNGPTDAGESPIDGLRQVAANDSTGSPPPDDTSSSATPGTFRGTVLAPSEPGGGNDTLATAQRIAGVTVTAYPRNFSSSDPYAVGPAAGTLVTGTDGMFQFTDLPGGEYIVTFVPPANSPYNGAWTTATAHERSGEHPWWVVLSFKE